MIRRPCFTEAFMRGKMKESDISQAFSKLRVEEAPLILESTRQGAKEEALYKEKATGAHGCPVCSRQSHTQRRQF